MVVALGCIISVGIPPLVAGEVVATSGTIQRAAPAPSGGALRTTLRTVLKLARWLSWVKWARDLADAVEEVIRLLDDAKRAADAQVKIDQLQVRIEALERELASARQRGAPAVVRRALTKLKAELERERRAFRSCRVFEHRDNQNRCRDKRLDPKPIVAP